MLPVLRTPALLLAFAAPALAQWHPAPDDGAAKQRMRLVAPEVSAALEARLGEQGALFERIIERHVPRRLETLRRLRNPQLRRLFVILLEHEDWTAVHRALLVLERMGETDLLDRARKLARSHDHPRVREKAAITVRLLELAGKGARPAERRFERGDGLLVADPPKAVPFRTPRVSVAPAPAPRWVEPTICWTGEQGRHADGAGLYACADGVVCDARPGNIAVVHSLPGKLPVVAVYGNAGPVAFVAAGDRVEAGQLIGTIGLGGLRFALRGSHGDALEPVAFLKRWRALTAPLVDSLRPLDAKLKPAEAAARAGQLGKAARAARRARDRTEPGSEANADAVFLLGLLEQAPGRALRRAQAMRIAGFPTRALGRLLEDAKRCRGLKRAPELAALAAEWKADDSFRKAVEGERKLVVALRIENPDRRRQTLERLAREYSNTPLAPRLPPYGAR